MRRKLTHSLLGMTLVAATVAAPSITQQAAAQGNWAGFTTASVVSGVTGGAVNNSPAFTAAITSDLGDPATTDLWVANHAERSEALSDWQGNANGIAGFDGVFLASPLHDSHGASFSDIDGDGDDDLIETSGRNHPTRVFINNNGNLNETIDPGLEDVDGRGRTVLMYDADNDGDMDALIVNLDRDLAPDSPGPRPSELYLNDGSGAFTPVPDPNEVLNDGSLRYVHLTALGPGEPQVVLTSNSFVFAEDTIRVGTAGLVAEPNPVNPSVGVDDNATSMRDIVLGDINGDLEPEWVVARQDDFLNTDEDGDGTPDLLGELAIGIGDVSNSALDSDDVMDISDDPLVDNCRSVSLADFDNDGDLDIFGGCTFLEAGQDRNVVLLNDGAGNFTIASAALVPATDTNTATVVVNADFNDDGWIDTYVGGGYDSQPGEDFIFLNEGGDNNWLKIDLEGSNPDVAGAQVFVGSDLGDWQVRQTGHRTHRGQDMKTLHFGLGQATAIAPVEIQWPDGTIERCSVAGINQTVTITQGGPDCETQTTAGLLDNLDAAPDMTPVNNTPPPPPAILCNDLVVTVNIALGETPTAGDDVIRGTSGDDVINGLGGNDTICALQGDDTIDGGAGFDKVFAGGGDDMIIGGAGNDNLVGGSGNDTIFGGTGNDRIQGGPGVDELHGEGGLDRVAGNDGNDIIRGGTHNDELFGNIGRDMMFGEGGDDVLRGGAWIDQLDGGPGSNDGCTINDPNGASDVRVNCEGGVFGR